MRLLIPGGRLFILFGLKVREMWDRACRCSYSPFNCISVNLVLDRQNCEIFVISLESDPTHF